MAAPAAVSCDWKRSSVRHSERDADFSMRHRASDRLTTSEYRNHGVIQHEGPKSNKLPIGAHPLRLLSKRTPIESVIERWLAPEYTFRPSPGDPFPEGSVCWDLGDKLLLMFDKRGLSKFIRQKDRYTDSLDSRQPVSEKTSTEVEVNVGTKDVESDERLCQRIFGQILADNTRTVEVRVEITHVGEMEPSPIDDRDD